MNLTIPVKPSNEVQAKVDGVAPPRHENTRAQRPFFLLVPKFHLGTHLFPKLCFVLGGVQAKWNFADMAFPSETWERECACGGWLRMARRSDAIHHASRALDALTTYQA